MFTDNGYINGFIERSLNGTYTGQMFIEGINISPINGVYFKQDGENYLWLKRNKILEYNDTTMSYKERDAKPAWEAYLKKEINNSAVAYKGEFMFMRFKFSIVGIWDKVLGTDKNHRLNLFVERLGIDKQNIINTINERKRNEQD